MPQYEWECECGKEKTEFFSMADVPELMRCVCNKIMSRVYSFNQGGGSGYSHISDALAVGPSQIMEHKRLFPDIKVHSDGRPEFTSVKQQSDYMDTCGFHKYKQKLKKKGKPL